MEGKNVLITGGSQGLGRALGRSLARRGHRVVLVARGQEALDRVVQEIREEGGVAHGVVADLGDQEAIYPLAGQAAALIGPIEVLVHNASTLGPTPLRLLMDTECEDLLRTLEVNLVGPFRLTKALAGHMALVGRGLVLHVSSDAAIQAYPRWGAYGVSKAALDHLSRTWAAELAEAGVRVLAIDPGEMDTAMHQAAMPEADRTQLPDPIQVAARLVQVIEAPARWPSGGRVVLSEVRS
jgi:NAD(P)-dependent dehydrogenase (short-subunit alcohol dehydrogenase family)